VVILERQQKEKSKHKYFNQQRTQLLLLTLCILVDAPLQTIANKTF